MNPMYSHIDNYIKIMTFIDDGLKKCLSKFFKTYTR